jgi:hypothetical protein
MYYIWFGAYPNHMLIQIIVKKTCWEKINEKKKKQKIKKTAAQIRLYC